MTMMLRVNALTKVYTARFLRRGGVIAVDGINFTVQVGEIISLVGESGSGKTTTAHIILHLLSPTSGEVVFEGQDIWAFKTKKELKRYWQKVHGIFQDPYAAFNPIYKVDRMLYQAFNLMDGGVGDKRRMVWEALKAVGLRPEEIIGRYPHQLSGGQRQRLMIARCYLLKPRLVIADEPVSMVDASGRAGILKLFLELRDLYQTALIFITHDLGLAYYLSDRILVMHKGKIVEKGTPEKVLSNPQHPYTKKLIADIPLIKRKWEDI
jgi:peptide/nickel transport system ATP-binding protein